jgi:hypothetical protein
MTGPERVLLLGCVKTKRQGTHPAKDLYTSPLFSKRRGYAEASGLPWFILSAEHGLVDPDQPIEQYDRTLNGMKAADREVWGGRVVQALRDRLGDFRGTTFEVHAGARYVDAIQQGIIAAHGHVSVALAHDGIGRQLAWYEAQSRAVGRG